ncbi:DUF362 domain-containing protein [Methanolobus mangrovi]|uniref:DUF362 domain-containing protein n=1 Tax=Methanolobus mangrovi TaxID=3072977 RepID=A0AA51UHJ6_9EURY|nr:DUF362 domain-containing protein [Methanolobus mangrovi]WMW23353.1 DUF362 domain-containing protein [Methanolobus mangrovi]
MKMKKHVTILLVSILMFSLIAGCITADSTSGIDSKTLEVDSNNLYEDSQETTVPDNTITEIPKVYMATDISPEGLMAVYDAMGRDLTGNVAVKISTGEPGGDNYLKPDLIKDLVQSVNGTIVECNTAYGGGRAETLMHKQVMIDHGFAAIAPTDIMDEEGEISLPVTVGEHLDEFIVGSHFENYDSWIILSHFKGHAMGGFGGALKNVAIGISSANGKSYVHTAGVSKEVSGLWGNLAEQDDFLESMAEANGAFMNEVGDNVVYINVLNRLSVDCDCDSSPSEPTMADIGIMASLDPIALDQASVDQIYAAPEGQDLIERMESRNATHILDYGAGLGLGSQEYELVNLDA